MKLEAYEEPVTASVALGNKRLLMLANYLDIADDEHSNKGEPAYCQSMYRHDDCKTPGCAWGHYVTMPHARKRKLHLGDPVKQFHNGTMAREFAIDSVQVADLFEGWGCNRAQTAAEAATFIRNFVKDRQSKAAS